MECRVDLFYSVITLSKLKHNLYCVVKYLPKYFFLDLKFKYSMLRRIADGSFGMVYQMQCKEIDFNCSR